jgi:hypothetical protein
MNVREYPETSAKTEALDKGEVMEVMHDGSGRGKRESGIIVSKNRNQ